MRRTQDARTHVGRLDEAVDALGALAESLERVLKGRADEGRHVRAGSGGRHDLKSTRPGLASK